MEKKCFKCGEIKPLTEFYKHPQMKDGHLNKCISCTKKDVHEKYEFNVENKPGYVDKERARGRDKYKRLGYVNRPTRKNGNSTEFKTLHKKLRNAGLINAEEEIHHWNYNLPYSIIILSRRNHAKLHKHLIFDEETKMFRTTKHNLLLKTIKHHIAYANVILSELRYYDDVLNEIKK